MKFRSQRTSHMEPSATSTTVTRPVGERLQAGTEDAPVLDRLAPLRRLDDSGAGYTYPELLTYRIRAVFFIIRITRSSAVTERPMLHVTEYFAKSLKITQGH